MALYRKFAAFASFSHDITQNANYLMFFPLRSEPSTDTISDLFLPPVYKNRISPVGMNSTDFHYLNYSELHRLNNAQNSVYILPIYFESPPLMFVQVMEHHQKSSLYLSSLHQKYEIKKRANAFPYKSPRFHNFFQSNYKFQQMHLSYQKSFGMTESPIHYISLASLCHKSERTYL